MNSILVIARKEIKELFGNRYTLILGIAFALFFSIIRSLALIKEMEGSTVDVSLDSVLFYLSAAIGFFMAYISASQIFLREKMNGVIETLLCAPISLRQIWFGKVLAITGFAYSFALLTVLIVILVSNILSGLFLLPGAIVIAHVLLVVPTFIAALTGLIGFAQFLLGMHENRIINFVIFMPAFIALYGVGLSASSSFKIRWEYIGILFISSILLLAITTYLTKHLSKERIVATIA
jgi:ABC-2 type transport system permease protein